MDDRKKTYGWRVSFIDGHRPATLEDCAAMLDNDVAGELARDLIAAQARIRELEADAVRSLDRRMGAEATFERVKALPAKWAVDSDGDGDVCRCANDLKAALAGPGGHATGSDLMAARARIAELEIDIANAKDMIASAMLHAVVGMSASQFEEQRAERESRRGVNGKVVK